jgi:uncharacterized protein (UPF0332 family)
MKSEASDYLAKARQCLNDAEQIAAATSLHHIVAREAYLAAFHAVEAYLFERTGKAAKTHRGLRTEFSRLARSDPRIDREFLTFLTEAYEYKSIADYGLGRSLHSITAEGARSAIDTAARLIDCIATLVA